MCVSVCLSFGCTRSTLWAVQLLSDCAPVFGLSSFCLCVLLFYLFCENLPASLPVVPPDGASSGAAAGGGKLMLWSRSRKPDLNFFTAGRTYFLLLYTVCALSLPHSVIVSLHPQSDRCSWPHGKTFLTTTKHSFRSKTAISTQVMEDETRTHHLKSSTLCCRGMQLPHVEK